VLTVERRVAERLDAYLDRARRAENPAGSRLRSSGCERNEEWVQTRYPPYVHGK
jgi:hypothetical protein